MSPRRRGPLICCAFALVLIALAPAVGQAQTRGKLAGWGWNAYGQTNVPRGGTFVAVAVAEYWGVALRSDGTLASWGSAPGPLPPGTNFAAIAVGNNHGLALRSDGTIAAWGAYSGTVPSGNNFIAIAAGESHSLALTREGEIVGWGSNQYGQINVPAGNNFIAISSWYLHSLALRRDGTIVGWGSNAWSQNTVPTGDGFVGIADGPMQSLALRGDGTVVAWGANFWGQGTSPARLTGAVSMSPGWAHNLALRSNGTLFGWGDGWFGASIVPAGDNYLAVAAGHEFSIVIRTDTDAPVVSVPADMIVQASSAAGATAAFTATAIDDADPDVAVTCTPASGTQFPFGATQVSCSSSDVAGNIGTADFTVTVVDTEAPLLTVPADVAVPATAGNGAQYNFVATAVDAVDGAIIPVCVPASGSLFPFGATKVTCSARDSRNNSSSASFTVTVAFAFSGFFPPIGNLPAINAVTAGRAVPVKFSLGSARGLAIFAAGFPASLPVSCSTGFPIGGIATETMTAGRSTLLYEATTGAYTYVWKTDRTWAGSCRQLVVELTDGTSHSAVFQFR